MADDASEHASVDDDPEAWRKVVAEGRLSSYEPGGVLQAFWTARSLGASRLETDLFGHLSDVVVHLLAGKAKSSLPDGGREIVDEVHFKILEAMLDPNSADGKAMVEHFEARVHFRFIDAVKRQRRRQQVELPPLVDDKGVLDEGDDPSALVGFASIEVGQVLSRIKDERKRLAFSLTLANHPQGEIAKLLMIDRKTLFRWLGEVRAFLKTELDL